MRGLKKVLYTAKKAYMARRCYHAIPWGKPWRSFDILFPLRDVYAPMMLRTHVPTLQCVRESLISGKMVCVILSCRP